LTHTVEVLVAYACSKFHLKPLL